MKLFVDAAWRKREGQQRGERHLIFPALSPPQPPPIAPMPRESPWLPITVGVTVATAAVAWYLLRTPAQLGAPTGAVAAASAPIASAPVIVAAAVPRPRVSAESPAPIVAASPTTAVGTTPAGAPDPLGPPSSTPPASEGP